MTIARTLWLVAVVCMASVVLSCGGGDRSDGLQTRTFAVQGHGSLILDVPTEWRDELQPAQGALPATILFTPPDGDAFKVFITPMWNNEGGPGYNRPDKILGMMNKDLRSMLGGAVEAHVDMQEFDGVHGRGYYFLVTDKAPGPGEHDYAVRAGLGVGDLVLSVTVLARAKDEAAIAATITALGTARQAYE